MNFIRTQRAASLISAYDDMPSVETGAPADQHLTDMLSDLRHFAADHGIDFESAVRMSEMHFEAEQGEDA